MLNAPGRIVKHELLQKTEDGLQPLKVTAEYVQIVGTKTFKTRFDFVIDAVERAEFPLGGRADTRVSVKQMELGLEAATPRKAATKK